MNTQKFKDILFPRFSEADAFALIVSSFLIIIDKKNKIVEFFMNDPDPRYLIICAAIAYWIIIVFKNVLSKNQISKDDKMYMAKTFFLVIGILSMASAFEYLLKPAYGYFEKVKYFDLINFFLVLLLLFRSLISLGVLRVLKGREEELVSQVTDDQATYFELILILVLSFLLYFAVTRFYSSANSIILTFYYSTVLARLIKHPPPVINISQGKDSKPPHISEKLPL